MRRLLFIYLFFISSFLFGEDLISTMDFLISNEWFTIGTKNNEKEESFKYYLNFNNDQLVFLSRISDDGSVLKQERNYNIYNSPEFISRASEELWIYKNDKEIAQYIIYFDNGWHLTSPMAISTTWNVLELIEKSK